MGCDSIFKRIVIKCHSIGIVMQPEINCHNIPLNLSFISQVMSQNVIRFQCLSVRESCQGMALKLPALSHSSHFIKLQASEPHKCWNRLCQSVCVCVFSFLFFPGNIVSMVYEAEVSPGHMRAGHESQALCLHFTNKLSLLQTGGKAAPHFFSFHFQ